MIDLVDSRVCVMRVKLLELLEQAYSLYRSGDYTSAKNIFLPLLYADHEVINKSTIQFYLKLCDIKSKNSKAASPNQKLRKKQSSEKNNAANKSNNLKNLIISNQLFDGNYYSSQYADVRDASIDPLSHYCQFGYLEDRDPHPHFNTKAFKRQLFHINSDLVKSNPLSAYLELPKDKKGYHLIGSFQYREYLVSPNKSLVDIDNVEFINCNKSIKIAVILHAYFYANISIWLDEIKKIPYHFHLIITTDTLEKQLIIQAALSATNIESYEILIVSNCGRDIVPFFKAINRLKKIEICRKPLRSDFFESSLRTSISTLHLCHLSSLTSIG